MRIAAVAALLAMTDAERLKAAKAACHSETSPQTGCGNPYPSQSALRAASSPRGGAKGGTDCRVAALLAMTGEDGDGLFQQHVQLVHIGQNIVGLTLCSFNHFNVSFAGEYQHRYGSRVLSHGNVGIQSVAYSAYLFV